MIARYAAGWNSPDREPDTTPVEFDHYGDAVAYLVRAVERLWDDDCYRQASSDQRLSIDARWLPVHTALHHAGDGRFHEPTADGSLEFWIRTLDSA